jgi:hypothetical protein
MIAENCKHVNIIDIVSFLLPQSLSLSTIFHATLLQLRLQCFSVAVKTSCHERPQPTHYTSVHRPTRSTPPTQRLHISTVSMPVPHPRTPHGHRNRRYCPRTWNISQSLDSRWRVLKKESWYFGQFQISPPPDRARYPIFAHFAEFKLALGSTPNPPAPP